MSGPVAAKPQFKMDEQADPVRDAIQAEAVALFEAGAYDDAGEKFYYLAEAAHNAGDPKQECTALQNMGTSLVMMGMHFEASRCYESAIKVRAALVQTRRDITHACKQPGTPTTRAPRLHTNPPTKIIACARPRPSPLPRAARPRGQLGAGAVRGP